MNIVKKKKDLATLTKVSFEIEEFYFKVKITKLGNKITKPRTLRQTFKLFRKLLFITSVTHQNSILT